MATISEIMTWANEEDLLKEHLRVTSNDFDTILQLYLAVMAEQADIYMKDDGAGFTVLPQSIRLAVYLGVGVFFERDSGSDGLSEVQTKDFRQKYADGAMFSADAAHAASRSLLRPYQCRRWLDGA